MSDTSHEQTLSPSPRPVRWLPLWIIGAVLVTAVIGIRCWPELSHQQKNIYTTQAVILSVPATLLWALLLSQLRWRVRFLVLASVVGGIALLAGLFRIRGVSGDLLPILEWRFQGHRTKNLALPTARPAPGQPKEAQVKLVSGTNEYPQFQGPHRDSRAQTPALAHDWEAHPPTLLWRHPVGPAWSGFAVSGGLAVTMEQRDEQETVVSYALDSGQVIWTHADEAHYHTTIAGEGPRTTPTILAGRVYAMGATGLLNCLELADGRVIWSKNVPEDNHGKVDDWGVSCSPLIVSNLVVVTTGAEHGRSLAAYDVRDGSRVWRAGEDRASYSSPALARLAGQEQILIFNSHTVAAHDPQSGALLWSYPWPAGHPHIVVPLPLAADQLLVSSGYGIGTERLQIERSQNGRWAARRLWKSNRLKSKFANLVELRGHIYGLDDGIMVCLDAASGELKWKEGRYGHGQMVILDDLLLVMAENGEVVLMEPTPEQPRVLTRFKALRGKTWNPPAVAGPCLLVRNDQEAACYALPTAR